MQAKAYNGVHTEFRNCDFYWIVTGSRSAFVEQHPFNKCLLFWADLPKRSFHILLIKIATQISFKKAFA